MATMHGTALPSNVWKFCLLWIGASIVSIFGGLLLGAFLNEILWTPLFPQGHIGFIINPIQRALVIGLSIGSIKSILEELVLQRYQVNWDGWIVANMFGWVVGVIIAAGVAMSRPESVIYQLLGGVIIGFSQWFVLRRYLPKAYWWIITSVISSFAILSWIPLGYTFRMMLESFVFFISAGLFMGVLTGTTLSWLLTLSWLQEY